MALCCHKVQQVKSAAMNRIGDRCAAEMLVRLKDFFCKLESLKDRVKGLVCCTLYSKK